MGTKWRGNPCGTTCCEGCECCAPDEQGETGVGSLTFVATLDGMTDDIPVPPTEGQAITTEIYGSQLNGDYAFAPNDYSLTSENNSCSIDGLGETVQLHGREVQWIDGVEESHEDWSIDLMVILIIERTCDLPGTRRITFMLSGEGVQLTAFLEEQANEPWDCNNFHYLDLPVDPGPLLNYCSPTVSFSSQAP